MTWILTPFLAGAAVYGLALAAIHEPVPPRTAGWLPDKHGVLHFHRP